MILKKVQILAEKIGIALVKIEAMIFFAFSLMGIPLTGALIAKGYNVPLSFIFLIPMFFICGYCGLRLPSK